MGVGVGVLPNLIPPTVFIFEILEYMGIGLFLRLALIRSIRLSMKRFSHRRGQTTLVKG